MFYNELETALRKLSYHLKIIFKRVKCNFLYECKDRTFSDDMLALPYHELPSTAVTVDELGKILAVAQSRLHRYVLFLYPVFVFWRQ
jgi:hypothetical protein